MTDEPLIPCIAAKKIMVAVPAHDGKTYVENNVAMISEMMVGISKGIHVMPCYHPGDSSIVHARNRIVAHFLSTDYTDLFFLDADVSWLCGKIIELASMPYGIVGGAYPVKREPEEYRVRWPSDGRKTLEPNEHGLIEVEGLPGGFMNIKREVLEDMVAKSEHLAYVEGMLPSKKAWMLFANPLYPRADGVLELWGEDLWFCKYARSLGHKIWLSPDIEMGHTGNKAFTGSVGGWLKRRDENGDNGT